MRPADWKALDSVLAGEVILPGAPGYDLASRALNARFDDVRATAVARCAAPADVSEAVRFARRFGMAVATRGGGHCFGGRSSTDGLLVDVTQIRSVRLSGGVARVGGGTRLGEVYDALLARNEVIPAGSCPSVGVAGLALGGGFGLIGRKHGLTSDSLLAAQIVLADGRMVECDEHHEVDLFWALRGAGSGNFGVVTELSFRTVPPPETTNFQLSWPFSQAEPLIEAWQAWAPAAPEELAASLLIKSAADPDDEPSVGVAGVFLGGEPDALELIDRLVTRAPADPIAFESRQLPFRETARYWGARAAREPVAGEPAGQELRGCRFIRSEYFRQALALEAIRALLGNFAAHRVAGETRELDFSPWGGAYNRQTPDATAFAHREERFILKHAGEVAPGAGTEKREAAQAWTRRSWNTVHPWASGRVFPNFPDPDLPDWPHAYYGGNLARLLHVKARYDPDGLFRFRQSLPVT